MKTDVDSENEALIEDRQVFTLAAQMLFSSFGQGGVVFNLDTRESHHLNPTAARVIELLDGRRNVKNIIEKLYRERAVDMQVLKTDVARFLKEIIDRGWIHDG